MSEITSEKFLKRQQVPKQMYSVLSQYGHKPIDAKVMEDMYKSLSDRAVRGTEEGVEILRVLLDTVDITRQVKHNFDDYEKIVLQKHIENGL